ncbi:MAG TPA: HlyD family efflux transporter periplasmic adaptor subunit [Burkholderiaceae bacterium]|nr:HlyD family efflux transporter periplasmic adaptor subunit [Burkholderiaceae bacterium]
MRLELESWLTQHCALGRNTALGAVLLRRDDALHVAACWPAGQTLPPRLAEVAAAAVSRQAAIATVARTTSQGEPLEVIAHPLEASGVLVGAVVVVLRTPQPLPPAVRTALAGNAQGFAHLLQAPKAPSTPQAPDAASRVLDVLQVTFERRDWQGSATALAATLADHLSCSRVTLGFRQGIATRVAAVSDGAVVNPQRGLYLDTAAAMDEAIDDGSILLYPQPAGAAPRIVAAHARLAKRQGLGFICTVPLVDGQRVVGAMLLERTQALEFDASTLALLESVSRLAGPWLAVQRRAARPWHEQAAATLRHHWRALQAPGHGRYKLAALSLGVMLGALCWIPAQREVRGTARLEGTVQRVMAAPGDGYLKQVMVRPGDAVAAGQVLLEFAGEDLQIERSRLLAELAGAQAAAGDAMSKHDRAQLAIQGAKSDELAAQVALLDQRIERAQMKAPFDAVVIAGDLAQSLGAPVRKGDALLTLAPSEGFRAIVEVEDADIAQVRRGQTGSMVLTAQPGLALPLRVQRITPLATQVEGRNVFEIEVAIEAPAAASMQELRPGMRGVARLHIGETPLALAWTRDVTAWLRLATWRWIG